MANFDFRLVKDMTKRNGRTEEWPLLRKKDESELEYYNRIAVRYTKDICHGDYHGKTLEEFQKEIENFNEEWQKVINRDPIIGEKRPS